MRAARSIGSATAIAISVVSTWFAAACTGDDPSINGASETPDAFVPSNDGGGEIEASSSADTAPPPEAPPAPQNKTSWAYYVGTEGLQEVPVAVADDGYSFAATRYTASIPDLPASPNAAAMMLVLLDANGKQVWRKGVVPARTGANFVPTAVAFDTAGDIYVAGWSNSAADFGGGVMLTTSALVSQAYGFVVKLRRSDGQGVWAKTFTSVSQAFIGALAVRGDTIAIAGTFSQSMALDKVGGGQTNLSAANPPFFVAALDRATGNAKWAKSAEAQVASGPPTNTASGVALDDAANVYVAGSFRGALSGLGASLVMIGNEENGSVASLAAATGMPRWSRRFGSASATSGLRVQGLAAAQGVVAIGGQVPAGTDFGDMKPVGTSGATDAFVAGFDPATGAPKWNAVLGGDDGGYDGEAINALAVDRWNQVVAVGDYRKTFAVNGTALVTPPVMGSNPPIAARCFFGVKIDATGKPIWAKSIASTVVFSGRSAAAHKSGSFVVAGELNGSNIDLGAGVIVSTGTSNSNLGIMGWTP